MLDKILIEKQISEPIYLQLVKGIKDMIGKGTLKKGDKLSSIRATAKYFNISKTTVETSYQILTAEGYLESKEKTGYYISGLKASGTDKEIKPHIYKKIYKYDFSNYYLDKEYFDKNIWKRHLNYVLKDEKNLNRYGENQGESELREAISSYIREYRGINASSQEIIIGAGFQSLLQLLLPNIKDKYNKIVFDQIGFPNGEFIFKQSGFKVEYFNENKVYDNCIRYIKSDESDYKEKIKFLKEAREKNILILEDDYNGEFRSFKRPIPALKSLDTFDNIVYFGAFSSILAPSIRISYLIVPKYILSSILTNISFYNQTSSTIEQLALAKFINNGYLGKSVRKMRKRNQRKRELLIKALDKYFYNKYKIFDTNSTVEMKVLFHVATNKHLAEQCEHMGIKLKSTNEINQFVLIFAGLSENLIEEGIKTLAKSWNVI